MKKILFGLALMSSISSFASKQMLVNIKNDLNKFDINEVQLTYTSKANLICGEFDDLSLVSKKITINYNPAYSLIVDKTIKSGLCTFKLSNIVIEGFNPYDWETAYVDLFVINSYNSKYLEDTPVTNYFAYNCSHSKEDYGCEELEEIATIESNEITIFLGSRI